jgi:predicted enzyme related to lactoylglutathione lyase
MTNIATTAPGNFVWYELLTTNPKLAPTFYEYVIGWASRPMDGSSGVFLFENEQSLLASVTELPERARQMGAPSYWTSHVQVASADATAATVKQLGGQVYVEPVNAGGIGRFAVIADPLGAVLSVFTPNQPMNVRDASKVGEFCWHELLSENAEASLAFYGKLFGWKLRSEFDMGAMGKYLLFGNEERDFGGMFNKPKEVHPSAWNYYVEVSDLDTAIERAKERGGKVCNGPMSVPGGARVAQLEDPQGAGFSLHEKPNG